MTPIQSEFLKSCFRLPGLAPEKKLNGKTFLNSEAFVFFVLKQIEQLSLPGLTFSAEKYLQTGKWGFTASLRINGHEEMAVVALREEDHFKDALEKMIRSLNTLIVKTCLPLADQKQTFIKKLLRIFAYTPAPSNLHVIEAGSDLFVGFLPQTLDVTIKLEDIPNRDMIPQKPFPFTPFSYQPANQNPEALVVSAWESADPQLLGKFTGLSISNKGGWHILDKNGQKINLNCRDHYADVIESLNRITKNAGARLYIQPYPWNKEIVFFITKDREEFYEAFLVRPNDEKKHRAKDERLKLRLIETYIQANPSDTEALGELTTCYGNLNQHKKVLELIDQYLLLAPDSYVLRNNKLIALVHLQRYKEGVEAAKEALKLRENSWHTRYFLGTCYTHLEQYEEAFFNLNFSVQEAPDQPFHWFALAYAYYKISDYDKAIEHYKTCISTSERYGIKESAKTSAWYNMSCIYSLQNNIEASKNAYIQALRLDAEYKADLFKDEELENLRNAVDAEEIYKIAGV